MGKIFTTVMGLIGLGIGYFSFTQFSDYYKKPSNFEISMLNTSAAYVQEWQGDNPHEPLNYLQKTIKILGKDPKFKNLGKLEKEVEDVNSQIGDVKSPLIYGLTLKQVGQDAHIAAENNTRNPGDRFNGIAAGIVSLIFIGGGLAGMKM